MKKCTVPDRPDLYDLMYSNFFADIPVYEIILNNCKRILLCGMGTGRVAIPFAKEGIEVIGIDNSSKMLNCFYNKIIEHPEFADLIDVKKADMRTFVSSKEIDAVLYAFSTFNYLLNIEDQKQCLSNNIKSLKKDGLVAFELLTKATFKGLNTNAVEVIGTIFENAESKMMFSRKTTLDNNSCILEQDRFFETTYKSGEIKKDKTCLVNRFISLEEIKMTLKAVGLKFVATYGDLNFAKFDENSEYLFIVAKK